MRNRSSYPWIVAALSGMFVVLLLVFASSNAYAVPAYARRYKISCYACHTIAPVLNEQGYMFKRLGHHLPPALVSSHEAPKISELVKKEPEWRLTNNAALAVSQFSFSSQRSAAQGQAPVSTSAFQVDAWNAYFTGWIPNTNFFYYSEFDIVTGGQTSPDMPNAHIGYIWGTAKNSAYAIVGREHLQMSEGTRAAAGYSLLPSPPLLLENQGPTNFIFDQSPVGAEVGYTWASSGYKQIVGANVKVTNGVNPDGTDSLTASNRNGKDVWFDADWWYAPESGISFVAYQGKKLQTQNLGLSNEFTFYPNIRRFGVFGNYMIARDKVDILGGYLHGNDAWEDPASGTPGKYLSNGYFAEVDYYIRRGLAAVGRYDRLKQDVTGGATPTNIEQWQVGAEKSFTSNGAVVGRLSFGNMHGVDPLAFSGSSTRTFQADIQFNF